MADTVVNRNHIFETVSASGTVYLTLDNQLEYWHRFEQHIKVYVMYDKSAVTLAGDGAQGLSFVSSEHISSAHGLKPSGYAQVVSAAGDDDHMTPHCHSHAAGVLTVQSEEQNKSDNQIPRRSTETDSDGPVQGFGGTDVCSSELKHTNNTTANPGSVCMSETDEVHNLDEAASGESTIDNSEDKDSAQDKFKKQTRSSERLSKMTVKIGKKLMPGASVLCKAKVKKDKMKINKDKAKVQQKEGGSPVKVPIGCLLKRKFESKTINNEGEKQNHRKPMSKTESKHTPEKLKAPKVRKLEQEKDVKCEYCLKTFKSQQEYFDHRKGDRTSFKCRICNKSVPFKAHLMVHMRKHSKSLQEDFLTLEDNKSGQNPVSSSLNDHDDCKGSKQIKCEICGLTVSNIPILKTHMMIHTGEYAYKCCVCGEKTHSIAKHNNHLSTHLKSGKVQCKICNISFESRSDLSKHQLTHEFKCSICDNVFPNKTSRVFHYKMAHKDDILKCRVCGKMFSSEEELDPHLKYHRNRAKTQCTTCGLFVTRLDNHMLSHMQRPEDGRMFVCDQCPKQFKQKLSFQRHLRTHSEEKPYACMECPKRFARSGGLRRHMITHTQEKPFVCDICGKACSQRGNLRIHMQIHKDSSSIQCQVGGEHFSYKNAMQEHMRSSHFVDLNSVEASRYMPATPQNYYI